nr:MAG TPA: hypothetical protein [Caudoviricetes sp.]
MPEHTLFPFKLLHLIMHVVLLSHKDRFVR